jgi:hypothetical protein
MIQSLNTLIVTLMATVTMAILVLFLPALIELKRPLDAGPRLIRDDFAQILLSTLKPPITNVEDGWKLDGQLTATVLTLFDFIPNLEPYSI